MRLIGPVLASIKPHMCAAAKTELDKFIQKPKRRELTIVSGAQCHSSELPDGTKVRIMCRMDSEEHAGVDVDLKHACPVSGEHNIQIRETWNGKASIEMRVKRDLIECRPHELIGHAIGDCLKLPTFLSRISEMHIETYEDHSDEMVLHLAIPA